jgi:hypothetical protein
MIEDTRQNKLLPLLAMAGQARVPGQWLRAEAEAGRIPFLRAGKKMLFHPSTVERLLAERAAGRETAPGAVEVAHARD